MLVVDLFSRHAEECPLMAEGENSEDLGGTIGKRLHSTVGVSAHLLSDRCTEFAWRICIAVVKMLGTVNEFTSTQHRRANEMIERLNHTLCLMLSYLVADYHKKKSG